jgi:hypothetical protein
MDKMLVLDAPFTSTTKAMIIQSVPIVAFWVITIGGIEFCCALALIYSPQGHLQNLLAFHAKVLHVRPVLSFHRLRGDNNLNLFIRACDNTTNGNIITSFHLLEMALTQSKQCCKEM